MHTFFFQSLVFSITSGKELKNQGLGRDWDLFEARKFIGITVTKVHGLMNIAFFFCSEKIVVK